MLDIPQEKLPHHIAIIMDGNGRWAKRHGHSRRRGHTEGAQSVQKSVDFCLEYGIPWLTLYAISTENWNRSLIEVSSLMLLLNRFIKQRTPEMMKKNVRLHCIGDLERLPAKSRAILQNAMDTTRHNTALHLTLALSYGSRQEITHAIRGIAEKISSGTLAPQDITEQTVADHLDTAGIPDPDLLIRTSGEMRISNFLLWQISYAELHVTDRLWPDFDREDFEAALRDYAARHRRFGKR